MDEPNAGAKPNPRDLEPRPPLEADLVALCRELNRRDARYIVVGGFAIIAAGLPRATGDIDLVVAVDRENEAKVFSALSTLPDNAVRELQPASPTRSLLTSCARPGILITRRLPSMSWSGNSKACPSPLPLLVCSG